MVPWIQREGQYVRLSESPATENLRCDFKEYVLNDGLGFPTHAMLGAGPPFHTSHVLLYHQALPFQSSVCLDDIALVSNMHGSAKKTGKLKTIVNKSKFALRTYVSLVSNKQ